MITTTFSEPRHRRFHAGIDVRTYGEIGSNIYAVQSGHVSRINIKPNNYGKAIYIKLDDGNTVLYAHLNNFKTEIEMLVSKLQKKYNSSFFDHYLSNDEKIQVSAGEIIGYSGDTGSLSGPHLHFEIRNNHGEPINPIKDYFKIEDLLEPIAKSISFIPLKSNSWVNGIQDYVTYDLININKNKYVLQDTIALIGDFGIAIETYDKINNLPLFKFGVYDIKLFIDNILTYSITFDKYNFSEDSMVYTEIDYKLLEEGKISHRLFNTQKQKLSFINLENEGIINLDNQFHNFMINVSDVNENLIQIQGVLIGEMNQNPSIDLYENIDKQIIIETNQNNISFNFCSKYNNIGCSEEKNLIQSIGNNIYEINNYDINYDVLEYFSINKKGLKSIKSYTTLYPFKPFKINGSFNLKHIEAGIIIEFVEDVFSGYTPQLTIKSDNQEKKITLYRKEKNILSSNILKINNLEKINLIYNTNPEIIFEKKISAFNPREKNIFLYKDYSIKADSASLYHNMLIWVEDSSIGTTKGYIDISEPITIYPNDIPFKKLISLSYNLNQCQNCSFYKFNLINNLWEYIETNNENNRISTKIASGGTYCILSDSIKPKISNLFPHFNSTYKKEDLRNISFNIEDNNSGINPYKINIILDGEKLFYDYIPYRKLINCNLNNLLSIGSHSLNINIYDNNNNEINISDEFIIIE